jgi:hypothetical protein
MLITYFKVNGIMAMKKHIDVEHVILIRDCVKKSTTPHEAR